MSQPILGIDVSKESLDVHLEVIIAGMRKLLYIAFGVMKNDCPFDPSCGQVLSQTHQIPAFAS
jgi:hypothetical protein